MKQNIGTKIKKTPNNTSSKSVQAHFPSRRNQLAGQSPNVQKPQTRIKANQKSRDASTSQSRRKPISAIKPFPNLETTSDRVNSKVGSPTDHIKSANSSLNAKKGPTHTKSKSGNASKMKSQQRNTRTKPEGAKNPSKNNNQPTAEVDDDSRSSEHHFQIRAITCPDKSEDYSSYRVSSIPSLHGKRVEESKDPGAEEAGSSDDELERDLEARKDSLMRLEAPSVEDSKKKRASGPSSRRDLSDFLEGSQGTLSSDVERGDPMSASWSAAKAKPRRESGKSQSKNSKIKVDALKEPDIQNKEKVKELNDNINNDFEKKDLDKQRGAARKQEDDKMNELAEDDRNEAAALQLEHREYLDVQLTEQSHQEQANQSKQSESATPSAIPSSKRMNRRPRSSRKSSLSGQKSLQVKGVKQVPISTNQNQMHAYDQSLKQIGDDQFTKDEMLASLDAPQIIQPYSNKVQITQNWKNGDQRRQSEPSHPPIRVTNDHAAKYAAGLLPASSMMSEGSLPPEPETGVPIPTKSVKKAVITPASGVTDFNIQQRERGSGLQSEQEANDGPERNIDDIDLQDGVALFDEHGAQSPANRTQRTEEPVVSEPRSSDQIQNPFTDNELDSGQVQSSSVHDFLNTRINLTQSNLKNQWLSDLSEKQAAMGQRKTGEFQLGEGQENESQRLSYTTQNKDRLLQIEQKIYETRLSLISNKSGSDKLTESLKQRRKNSYIEDLKKLEYKAKTEEQSDHQESTFTFGKDPGASKDKNKKEDPLEAIQANLLSETKSPASATKQTQKQVKPEKSLVQKLSKPIQRPQTALSQPSSKMVKKPAGGRNLGLQAQRQNSDGNKQQNRTHAVSSTSQVSTTTDNRRMNKQQNTQASKQSQSAAHSRNTSVASLASNRHNAQKSTETNRSAKVSKLIGQSGSTARAADAKQTKSISKFAGNTNKISEQQKKSTNDKDALLSSRLRSKPTQSASALNNHKTSSAQKTSGGGLTKSQLARLSQSTAFEHKKRESRSTSLQSSQSVPVEPKPQLESIDQQRINQISDTQVGSAVNDDQPQVSNASKPDQQEELKETKDFQIKENQIEDRSTNLIPQSLQKHMEGIDTIQESEPNFEQTQKIDLNQLSDGSVNSMREEGEGQHSLYIGGTTRLQKDAALPGEQHLLQLEQDKEAKEKPMKPVLPIGLKTAILNKTTEDPNIKESRDKDAVFAIARGQMEAHGGSGLSINRKSPISSQRGPQANKYQIGQKSHRNAGLNASNSTVTKHNATSRSLNTSRVNYGTGVQKNDPASNNSKQQNINQMQRQGSRGVFTNQANNYMSGEGTNGEKPKSPNQKAGGTGPVSQAGGVSGRSQSALGQMKGNRVEERNRATQTSQAKKAQQPEQTNSNRTYNSVNPSNQRKQNQVNSRTGSNMKGGREAAKEAKKENVAVKVRAKEESQLKKINPTLPQDAEKPIAIQEGRNLPQVKDGEESAVPKELTSGQQAATKLAAKDVKPARDQSSLDQAISSKPDRPQPKKSNTPITSRKSPIPVANGKSVTPKQTDDPQPRKSNPQPSAAGSKSQTPGSQRGNPNTLRTSRSVFSQNKHEQANMYANIRPLENPSKDPNWTQGLQNELKRMQSLKDRQSHLYGDALAGLAEIGAIAQNSGKDGRKEGAEDSDATGKGKDGEVEQSSSSSDDEHQKNGDADADEKARPSYTGPSMMDLVSKYQTRVEYYQDFYKSVKTYKNFNPEAHYEDFVQRKSMIDQRKREAQSKTTMLFQDAKARQSEVHLEEKKMDESPISLNLSRDSGARPSTQLDQSNQRQVKSALSRPGAGHQPATESTDVPMDSGRAIPEPQSASESRTQSSLTTQRGPKLSSNNKIDSMEQNKSQVKSSRIQRDAQQASKNENALKQQQAARVPDTSTTAQSQNQTKKNAQPVANKADPKGNIANQAAESQPSEAQLQQERAIYEGVKRDLKKAFSQLGLSENDQLWHMHEDPTRLAELDAKAKNAIYLSKMQYRNLLIDLGYLQDFNRLTPKIHQQMKLRKGAAAFETSQESQSNYFNSFRKSQMTEQISEDSIRQRLQKIETKLFGDSWDYLVGKDRGNASTDHLRVDNELVNIQSAKVFILALNGVVQDWMIKGKPIVIKIVPPKVAQAVQPKVTARLSTIEKRLLGKNRVESLENENLLIPKAQKRSTISDKQDAQWSAKELVQTVDCDFFQFKHQNEARELQTQFSHMILNKKEFEYQSRDVHTPTGSSPGSGARRYGRGNDSKLEDKSEPGSESRQSRLSRHSASRRSARQSTEESKHSQETGALQNIVKNSGGGEDKTGKVIQDKQDKNKNAQARNKTQAANQSSKIQSDVEKSSDNNKKIDSTNQLRSQGIVGTSGPSYKSRTQNIRPGELKQANPLPNDRVTSPMTQAPQIIETHQERLLTSSDVPPRHRTQDTSLYQNIKVDFKNMNDVEIELKNDSQYILVNSPSDAHRTRQAAQQDGQMYANFEPESLSRRDATSPFREKWGFDQELNQKKGTQPLNRSNEEKRIENYDMKNPQFKAVPEQKFENEKRTNQDEKVLRMQPESISNSQLGSKNSTQPVSDIYKKTRGYEKNKEVDKDNVITEKKSAEIQVNQTVTNVTQTAFSNDKDTKLLDPSNQKNRINDAHNIQRDGFKLPEALGANNAKSDQKQVAPPSIGVNNLQPAENTRKVPEEPQNIPQNQTENQNINPSKNQPESNQVNFPEREDLSLFDEEAQHIGEDPILILDIKLIKDRPEKITVYENDDPEDIVHKFCTLHNLDTNKQQRLLKVIKSQIQEYYEEQEANRQREQEAIEDEPKSFNTLDGSFPHSRSTAMMRENQLAQIDENANETENTFDDDEEDFPTTEL